MPLSDLPTGMRVMELKLTAAGMSVGEVHHLKDLKYSAEYLLQEWLHKFGPVEAEKRYQHLRVLVREDCLTSSSAAKALGALYGEEMLTRLRQHLRARAKEHGDQVLGVSAEHLLGVAGILTEDCKVWWSEEFPIVDGNL